MSKTVISSVILAACIAWIVPATLYHYNQAVFDFPLYAFILQNTFSFIVIFIGLYVLTLPGGKWSIFFIGCYQVCAIYLLFVNFVLPVQVGLLDGVEDKESLNSAATQLATYGAVFVAIALFRRMLPGRFYEFATLISATAMLWISYLAFESYLEARNIASSDINESKQFNANSFYRLSSKNNVLIFSFDSLQGSIVNDVIRSDPQLQSSLDGFVFYPDASSVAPNTTFSLLSTILGRVVPVGDEGIQLPDAYASFAESSILSRLNKSGFHTATYNIPCQLVAGGACIKRGDLIDNPRSKLTSPENLTTLSLLRVLPTVLSFKVAALITTVEEALGAEKSVQFGVYGFGNDLLEFRRYKDSLVVDIDAPVAQFHHYLFSHQPLKYDANCNYQKYSDVPQNSLSAREETKCVLKEFSQLLEKLKQLGVYDNALIFMISDHGYERNINTDIKTMEGAIFHASFVNQHGVWPVGRYNTALLYKEYRHRGPLKRVDKKVSMLDISFTLSARNFSKDRYGDFNLQGRDLADREDNYQARPFIMYVGADKFFREKQTNSSHFRHMNYQGSVFQGLQQAMATAIDPYCFESIDFSTENDRKKILTVGVSITEAWGSWTDAEDVLLYFPVFCNSVSGKQIHLSSKAFVNKQNPTVSVAIFLNDTYLGEERFTAGEFHDQTARELVLTLPKGALINEQVNILRLEITGARSPRELGVSDDHRKLGLGLIEFSID